MCINNASGAVARDSQVTAGFIFIITVIIGMNQAMSSIGKDRWTARFNFNELIVRGVNK